MELGKSTKKENVKQMKKIMIERLLQVWSRRPRRMLDYAEDSDREWIDECLMALASAMPFISTRQVQPPEPGEPVPSTAFQLAREQETSIRNQALSQNKADSDAAPGQTPDSESKSAFENAKQVAEFDAALELGRRNRESSEERDSFVPPSPQPPTHAID